MHETKDDQPAFQQGLLENGLDFILSAVEHAAQETPRDLKYAIMHLVDGMELLVKARLEQEHWSLLFSQADKASQVRLKSGDFKSVDFEQACERLKSICGVELDATSRKYLDDLRKRRNVVRHYKTELEVYQVRSLLAQCLNVCRNFCESQFPDLPDGSTSKKLLSVIWDHLVDNNEFVSTRLQAIAPDLEGYETWKCPACWQDAVLVDDGDTSCKFCGVSPDARDLAEQNNLGMDLGDCRECGMSETVALREISAQTHVFVCSYCGTRGDDLEECCRCGLGALFPSGYDPDVWFCDNCRDHIMRE